MKLASTTQSDRNVRSFPWSVALLGLVFSGAVAVAQDAARADKPKATAAQDIEVSADTMDMDFEKRLGTFKGNVHITDPRMQLMADEVKVYFTESNEVKQADAIGNVVIIEAGMDRRATGEMATYYAEEAKVVLTGKPKLIMGENSLTNAAMITYFLNSKRVICSGATDTGRSRIRIAPKTGKTLGDMLKTPEKGSGAND